jgi:hypothetical protein
VLQRCSRTPAGLRRCPRVRVHPAKRHLQPVLRRRRRPRAAAAAAARGALGLVTALGCGRAIVARHSDVLKLFGRQSWYDMNGRQRCGDGTVCIFEPVRMPRPRRRRPFRSVGPSAARRPRGGAASSARRGPAVVSDSRLKRYATICLASPPSVRAAAAVPRAWAGLNLIRQGTQARSVGAFGLTPCGPSARQCV